MPELNRSCGVDPDGKRPNRLPPWLVCRPRVVIIGGGFGGLSAAKALRRVPVSVTLIDHNNYHLFQPLLYQVATAGLSPADIASPIRSILRRQRNVTVLLDQVQGIDLNTRTVHLTDGQVGYEYLILAAGAQTNYFGHPEWEEYAVGLKDVDDAVEVRRRVLLAFEAAEKELDPERRRALMTIVVIGGGPTGVEMAGALAELSTHVLARDFRTINPAATRVLLLEGGPRILPTFAPDLSRKAHRQLLRRGIEVRTGAPVTNITPEGVYLGEELIQAQTVIWAAGVTPSPLTATLGAPLDRAGRVLVEPDLSIPPHPAVFVIGDAAAFTHQGGVPLPGLSPVAMQEGRAVARTIAGDLRGRPRRPFHYVDKGTMATIGRSAAVAERGRLRANGLVAWLLWLLVHIFFLIGFRNRVVVFINWLWSYLTYQQGARLITGHRMRPGAPALAGEPDSRILPPVAGPPLLRSVPPQGSPPPEKERAGP